MAIPALLGALLPSLISAGAGLANTLIGNRSARKEARKMNAYNSPKAQMKRFREGGLSPYLIYGQGTPGNMSSPIPAVDPGIDKVGEGISDYFTRRRENQEYKTGGISQDILLNSTMQKAWFDSQTAIQKNRIAETQANRVESEFLSDFPKFMDDAAITRGTVTSGYRMKMNELKRAFAEANLGRMHSMIRNMGFRNSVDEVRARYAKDFGMVGGDWTQGLGLIKSIPSFFKKSASRGSGKLSGIPSKPRN